MTNTVVDRLLIGPFVAVFRLAADDLPRLLRGERRAWTAWYRLPTRDREQRPALLRASGGYRFSGYAEIVARYFIWAKEPLLHPLEPWRRGRRGG